MRQTSCSVNIEFAHGDESSQFEIRLEGDDFSCILNAYIVIACLFVLLSVN